MRRKQSQKAANLPVKDFKMTFLDFKVIDLSFSLNSQFKGKKGISFEHNIETGIGYNYDAVQRNLKVRLEVSVSGEKSPYHMKVKGIGAFEFEENQEQEFVKYIAGVNCPAIIYPYIRETIADITRRAGFPPLHLQPVNFAKLYVDRSSEKK